MTALMTIDLFAGCGGLSLGLHNAGHNLLFAVEKDPMAFDTFKGNFLEDGAPFATGSLWPDWLEKAPHDIERLLDNEAVKQRLEALRGTVDLVCGGPPCQGFSVGGIRDGQDSRNRLPLRYLEFTDIVRPSMVLLENVEGMARKFRSRPRSHDESYADWLVGQFRSRGYNVALRILNAADFGVPQARKRVFIFGYLESAFPATAIDADEFFEQVQNCRAAFLDAKGLSPERPVSVEEAIDDLNGLKLVTCPDSPKFKAGTYKTPSSAYAQLMRMGVAANAIPDSHRFSEHNPATLAFYKKVHADGRFGRLPKEYLRAHGTKKDKKVLIDPRAPASTITTHPDEFIHYEHPRNVSVREMARLQSFPDLFRFRGRYTINGERRRLDVARCSQVGNAVPPFLGEVLGVALRAFSERLRHSFSCAAEKPQRAGRRLRGRRTAVLSDGARLVRALRSTAPQPRPSTAPRHRTIRWATRGERHGVELSAGTSGGETMTNEELAMIRAYVAERQAARARGEHIDSDERREAALLEALDEATRERDAAEIRGAQWALDACYLAIMRDRTPPIALDAGQRSRDAARICAEAGAATCPRCGVYHADGPRACVSVDPHVSARALIEHREAAMVRVMEGAREERDRAEKRLEVAERDLAEARSQLAALHAAAARLVHSLGEDEEEHPTLGRVRVSRPDDGAEEALDGALADLAAAAREHDVQVRADERVKALREAIDAIEVDDEVPPTETLERMVREAKVQR